MWTKHPQACVANLFFITGINTLGATPHASDRAQDHVTSPGSPPLDNSGNPTNTQIMLLLPAILIIKIYAKKYSEIHWHEAIGAFPSPNYWWQNSGWRGGGGRHDR